MVVLGMLFRARVASVIPGASLALLLASRGL